VPALAGEKPAEPAGAAKLRQIDGAQVRGERDGQRGQVRLAVAATISAALASCCTLPSLQPCDADGEV
jgi:hypothetical protein